MNLRGENSLLKIGNFKLVLIAQFEKPQVEILTSGGADFVVPIVPFETNLTRSRRDAPTVNTLQD